MTSHGMRFFRRSFVLLPLAAVVFFTGVAPAAAGRAGDVTFDLGLMRPLGFIRTVVGVPFFLVTAPFLLIDGPSKEGYDLFVRGPFDDTFRRDLGDF